MLNQEWNPVPKPPARIKNRQAIDRVKQATGGKCEYPGCGRPALGDPHHPETVGSGGPDIPENQVHLCGFCHLKAHQAAPGYSKLELFRIIAHRMCRPVENIIESVEQAMGRGIKLWHKGVRVR